MEIPNTPEARMPAYQSNDLMAAQMLREIADRLEAGYFSVLAFQFEVGRLRELTLGHPILHRVGETETKEIEDGSIRRYSFKFR